MSLSVCRIVARIGHIKRAKRVVGHLAKMKHTVIRFWTGLPDYFDIPCMKHDWEHSLYNNVTEELPKDTPEAL